MGVASNGHKKGENYLAVFVAMKTN